MDMMYGFVGSIKGKQAWSSQEPRGTGRKIRRGQSAFTLPEVIVAAFVLTIIGVGYFGGLASGFGVLQTTRENLRATQIMTQKLEAIRLCTWSQLSNLTFTEKYNPLATNSASAGATYVGTLSIGAATNLANSPTYQNNMALVTVNISWTNYNRGTPLVHARQMQSQVARYGLQNYVWGALK